MKTTAQAPKLVVSFSGLLARLAYGSASLADLDDTTLYYFGCTRDLALDAMHVQPEYVDGYGSDTEQRREIYAQLQPILRAANDELRLGARDEIEDRSSYEDLNALLVQNGIPPLDLGEIDMSNRHHYNLPTVRELAEAAGIQVIGF